jgi:glycosyl transferase family 11
MIFFYGEGRLGNQIFQYQALSQLAKAKERIISVGLEDLQRSLELCGPKLVVLTRNRLLKRVIKYAVKPLLLRPLARTLRLLNYASETSYGVPPNDGASGELSMRAGLLRGFTFVDGGHYQNSSYWTSLFPTPLFRIKATLRDAARRYLDSICGGRLRPTFVHVRRGDYLTHTDYGLEDLLLPANFYRMAIAELTQRAGRAYLVFVTDDPAWVEEHFRDISDKSVISFDAEMDFAIMTECANGILSNSTFSLAAAFMLKSPDVVIAPKHWFGFRVGAWYPPKIYYQHPKLIYLTVEAEAADLDMHRRCR